MAVHDTLQLGFVLALVSSVLGDAAFVVIPTNTSATDRWPTPSDDLFVGRGLSIKLDCDDAASTLLLLQTSQTLEMRWFFRGQLINDDDGRFKLYNNGTLLVARHPRRANSAPGVTGKPRDTPSFEGLYQCFFVNPRDGSEVYLARSVNLRQPYMKEFTQQPGDENANEGQSIILPCSINSMPPAVVQWERDEKPLPRNKKYVPLSSGSLLITNVHSSDVGSYRCKVVNSILKKTKRSQPGYIQVLSEITQVATDTMVILPLNHTTNLTTLVGREVTLYCIANGLKNPIVQWRHDNSTEIVSNSSILTLTNISLKHSGRYVCNINSQRLFHTREYFVSVKEAPTFNSTPSSGVHTLARGIRLNCTASGYPPPKIFWYKNGIPLDLRSHIRANVSDWGLLISSATMSDSGTYQCLAVNEAGSIWTKAALRMNVSANSPLSEPRDLQCLPFKEDSICLKWNGEANALKKYYYMIIAHRTGSESKPLKEYVTNETNILLDKLHLATNYTFLIRTFTDKASPEFVSFTCTTGVHGIRNLTIQMDGASAVRLHWYPISSDSNPCANRSKIHNYNVQWRNIKSEGWNSLEMLGFEYTIHGLQPGSSYKFRVKPSSESKPISQFDSLSFVVPSSQDNHPLDDENNIDTLFPNASETSLQAPFHLQAVSVTSTSVNVSWFILSDGEMINVNPEGTTYNLCYLMLQETSDAMCDTQGKRVLEVTERYVILERLHPKADYEIRVQAQYKSFRTSFSHALLFTTPSDVPSEVQNLEFRVLSQTSACVKWEPPKHINGRILKYSIRHTAEANKTINTWQSSSVLMPRSNHGCWDHDSEGIIISTVLHNLNPDALYRVNVMAVNDAGSGSHSLPLIISTKYAVPDDEEVNEGEYGLQGGKDLFYRQGIGVVLGFAIALVLICALIGIYFINKCLQRRLKDQRHCRSNGRRGGTYQNANRRSKQGSGQICFPEVHELQHLVESNGHSRIPIGADSHLDTKVTKPKQLFNHIKNHVSKGGNEFPNGIQVRSDDCSDLALNGHGDSSELTILSTTSREYEEDSNSNLQKVYPKNAMSLILPANNMSGPIHCNSSLEWSLDNTGITILHDNSIAPHCQPTLEPNG